MAIKVTQITANNIRGIRELQLPLDTNILVLGENGCGKSSIVDAIEYYFTGRVEKLTGRQDVRESESLQFVGGGPLSVAFRFSEDANDYFVSFPHSLPQIPDRLETFFKFASERPFILRRSQLLQFIDARPSKRYDLVSKLIGLGDLDDIEDAWRSEVTELENVLQAVQDELSGIVETLVKLLNVDIISEQQIIHGINQKLAEHEIEPISQYPDMENRKAIALNKSANPENIRKAEQIRQLKRKVDNLLNKLDEIPTAYDQLFNAWQSFLSNAETADEAIFEKLLIEALRIVSTNALEICPLCEEPITNQQNLRCRLEERTNALQAFTKSRKEKEEQYSIFSQAVSEFSRLLTELVAELSEQEFEEQASSLEKSIVLQFSPWRERLVKRPLTLNRPEEFRTEHFLLEAKSILEKTLIVTQEQIDALTPSDEESHILKLVDLLSQVDTYRQLWVRASNQNEIAEKKHLQIKMVYDELVVAKKRGLDQILAQLEENFVDLYEYLHPAEGYEKISLALPPSRGKSIGLEANKEGNEAMHPLGIFSEGHLDSLGLCIFLAFIKRFNEDFKLIVLDDILTSIDAGHRMRVAQLLAREFSDYQIILTTHDEMWANEILGIFRNKGISLKNIYLNPWDQETGATYDEYIATDWDYYLEQARRGHKQDAIAGIGRTLEKFLLTMRRQLHLAVPATIDDRYTLGDLSPVFFRWVEGHKFVRPDIPDLWQRYEVLKEEFDAYWRLRNWSGAHYNDWGATVSIPEAVQFIQIVEDIVQIFICPACGSLVVYDIHHNLVHCPRCQAVSQPRVVWTYEPQSLKQIKRMLAPECQVASKEQHIVRGSLSNYERFLQDSRRKLRLPVQATPDDQYGFSQLHPVYVDFLSANPREEFEDWDRQIQESDTIVKSFPVDENGFVINLLEARANEVFTAIQNLIDLGSCLNCKEILSFDTETEAYFCDRCRNKNEPVSLVANWYVG